jgi:hypothetical protein
MVGNADMRGKEMTCLCTILAALVVSVSVFSAASAQWTEVVGGAWHPDAKTLLQVDEALQSPVADRAADRGGIRPWAEYSFQYQGRKTLLGKRYIYINGFCIHGMAHLDRVWVDAMDGGSCFFRAKYDPEKNVVYDLAVNGVA